MIASGGAGESVGAAGVGCNIDVKGAPGAGGGGGVLGILPVALLRPHSSSPVTAPSPRPSLAARWADVQATLRYYGRGLVRELMTKDIFLWAQAIAFKVLVTFVPLLLLGTGIVGQLLQRERPYELVERLVADLLPPYQTAQTLGLLRDLSNASNTITVAGTIGLLVSAVSLMTTLRAVVSNVFREDYHRARTILGGYAFDARMVVQVGAFFVLSITLSVFLSWVSQTGSAGLEEIGLDGSVWAELVRRAGIALPFVLTVGMFAQLYASVPTPRPPWKSVLRGSLVAAVLWEVAKQAFTAYAVNLARFNVGTTFGLVLALVFWVYYSGLVLCIGAILVLLSEKRVRAARALDATVRPLGSVEAVPAAVVGERPPVASSAVASVAAVPPAPAAVSSSARSVL